MDTVFSDWKTTLQDFKDSVEKDLGEIRKQKAEIQQIKHDIFSRLAQGQYIHDDHRIVLSAPEIIIGNVDSSGMLWSESGSTITIRGNGVNLEGSGEGGYVKSRATSISQIAVDPGIDGEEDVVRPGSSVVSQARNIVIQSNDCDGCFSQLPTSLVGSGVSIHSDGQMAIDASRSVDVRGTAISDMLTALNSQKSTLSTEAQDRLNEVSSITDDLKDILEDMDDLTDSSVEVRSNIGDLLDLQKNYDELVPSLVPAIERCVRTISALAEVNRKISCLEDEQTALDTESSTFTDYSTGASLALTAEQISLASVDGDGNIRTNAEASVSIQTGKVNIETVQTDGTLIADSSVFIHTESVDISTIETLSGRCPGARGEPLGIQCAPVGFSGHSALVAYPAAARTSVAEHDCPGLILQHGLVEERPVIFLLFTVGALAVGTVEPLLEYFPVATIMDTLQSLDKDIVILRSPIMRIVAVPR